MVDNQVEHITISRIVSGMISEVADQVAIEEPLEIQIAYSTTTGRIQKSIAVTMRTPGNDAELAAGFLFTENVIDQKNAISDIRLLTSDKNKIVVVLQEGIEPRLGNMHRNFYTTSSCGICGKASIDSIITKSPFAREAGISNINAAIICQLNASLKEKQVVFENTGGIHASALFDHSGELLMLREDVGRHNALDKLIGSALLEDRLPLANTILLLSGRASFELVQKAVVAGVNCIVAVGAPSSLAVDLAKESEITLIGFVKHDRFNIYCGAKRIIY